MANIIRTLENEMKRGTVYFDANGNGITEEKLESMAKKQYVEALRKGIVGFEVSYTEYCEMLRGSFMTVSGLLDIVKAGVGYTEPEVEVPEGSEPDSEPLPEYSEQETLAQ